MAVPNILTIDEIKERIAPLMKANEVTAAYLFGSYARGEATAGSDVDLRVDLGQSKTLYGLFQVAGFREALTKALGKEVDLLTHLPQSPLSQGFLAHLRQEELLVYTHEQ